MFFLVKKRAVRLLSTIFAIFMSLAATEHTFGECGGDRWNVKAGIDADAASVNANPIIDTTVLDMRSLVKPAVLPDNNRVPPTELTTWRLSATLVKYVRSYDSDYHLVIRDEAGRTMIAEIPDPNCIPVGSPFKTGIAHARSQFDGVLTPTTSFQDTNVPVTLTGIGFFDHDEGQEGIAPNGIELHPVIDIIFGPTYSLSSAPAALTITQGGTGSTSVSTSLANGFSSQISLSAVGLPAGTTASFDPQTLAAPGQGSSNLTFSVDAGTPTGTYNVTVTGAGDGQTRSSAMTLTVTAAGGGSQQLLGNAGFENGSSNATPWTATAGVIDSSSVQPSRSGAWKAWLNGFGTTHTDTLLQTVNIPGDVSSAALSFWLHIDTAETTTTKANDTLKVQVRNGSGTVLRTLATFSNLNRAPGYVQMTYDLLPNRGQTVQVYLIGVENGSAKTSFVVDDFSLTITRSTQTPDLALGLSSQSLSLSVGSAETLAVTTSTSGGFNSEVSLSIAGLPLGTNGVFSPNAIAAPGSGSASLAISTTTSATPGTYPITVTAGGGGLARTAQFTLTISAQTGGVTRQILSNGGFENGSTNPTPWTVSKGVIDNNTIYQPPRSGTWKAWMNGYGVVHTDTLYQQVTISSTATAAKLTVWRHIDTEEKSGSAAYDTLKVQVRSSSGAVLSTLATFSNQNAVAGYVQTTYDLLQFRGQTVQIYFVGTEDGSLKTSFVFDDVSLEVTTPQ
jgi:hypothetical protein